MRDDPLTVIFVGGSPRSGSTVLDLVLGQVDGFFAAGELEYIWERGVAENQLCGCGLPFRECPFWTEVMGTAFGGWAQADALRVGALQRSVLRTRYLPFLIAQRMPGRYRERMGRYGEVIVALYRAILTVSGSRVLVDSSKSPAHGFLLNAIPQIDLRVIHLIRDSRAVAFSYLRVKPRPEIRWQQVEMLRYSPVQSARLWGTWNVLTALLRRLGPPSSVLRYEEFARSPEDALGRVLAAVGEDAVRLSFMAGGTVDLVRNHTVSGNPMRFQRGRLEIRPDVEWRTRMQPFQRRLVTALTWPWLLAYGYVGRSPWTAR